MTDDALFGQPLWKPRSISRWPALEPARANHLLVARLLAEVDR